MRGPWPLPLKLNHSYSACASGDARKPRFHFLQQYQSFGMTELVFFSTRNCLALIRSSVPFKHHKAAPPVFNHKTRAKGLPCSKRRRVSVTHDTLAEQRCILQLETLRHWSSRQPPQLALQTPLSTPIKWSKCSRVVRRRCKAFPHNRRRKLQLVTLRHWSSHQLGSADTSVDSNTSKYSMKLTAKCVRCKLAVKRSCRLKCSLCCTR